MPDCTLQHGDMVYQNHVLLLGIALPNFSSSSCTLVSSPLCFGSERDTLSTKLPVAGYRGTFIGKVVRSKPTLKPYPFHSQALSPKPSLNPSL